MTIFCSRDTLLAVALLFVAFVVLLPLATVLTQASPKDGKLTSPHCRIRMRCRHCG